MNDKPQLYTLYCSECNDALGYSLKPINNTEIHCDACMRSLLLLGNKLQIRTLPDIQQLYNTERGNMPRGQAIKWQINVKQHVHDFDYGNAALNLSMFNL